MTKAKNIVLTGAARGIGRAMARTFCLQGHHLFLIDVDEEELAYCARKHIPSVIAKATTSSTLDGNPGFKACDLRDPDAVRKTIKAVAKHFEGRIHVLINNAGIAKPMWSKNRTMEDPAILDEWTAYLETNLPAPFVVSQACIPYMKMKEGSPEGELAAIPAEASAASAGKMQETSGDTSDGGCIINISSFRAKQSQANCEGYGASKAGLLGLTHAMAISGAQWGIRCNAILPGYIDVMHESRQADENDTAWAQEVGESQHRSHPSGRVGRGEDIAHAAEWLMDAGFVNGQEVVVDGGVSKIKYSRA
ncbi:Short chain dehydrogenase [Pleurostoma richardsiae]|uniref:Short chain dehydrogenase n=1 Tax=Pleurostoma richardsiae TaxID=41990 RepID=A0AA38RAD4_9PEZI|nr:Short chain dehydrogenase [Pleurostoma richardsiae]